MSGGEADVINDESRLNNAILYMNRYGGDFRRKLLDRKGYRTRGDVLWKQRPDPDLVLACRRKIGCPHLTGIGRGVDNDRIVADGRPLIN